MHLKRDDEKNHIVEGSCVDIVSVWPGVYQYGAVQHPHHAPQCLPLGHQRPDGGMGVRPACPALPAAARA